MAEHSDERYLRLTDVMEAIDSITWSAEDHNGAVSFRAAVRQKIAGLDWLTDPAEEDAIWAHVFMHPESHEPTLLDDDLLAEVRDAIADITAGQFIDRAWIRPGPTLDVAPTSVGGSQ